MRTPLLIYTEYKPFQSIFDFLLCPFECSYPVDNYYYEGKRTAVFLGEKVTKYHRTLTTYLNTLLSNGFIINQIVEPQPPENMMDIPGMQDEMRRPMMLIVSANKKMDRYE